MKTRRPSRGDSGLAFLDVIACGFGAVVLLLLVAEPPPAETAGPEPAAVPAAELGEARDLVDRLRAALAAATKPSAEGAGETPGRDAAAADAEGELQRLRRDNRGLELVRESLRRAALRVRTPVERRDREVGGIPVDGEYVVFVVDTSGSMRGIWDRVTDVMTRVLDIHPEVRGFQVMNDQGAYLVKAYGGKWIPDTPGHRRSVLAALRGWSPFSNSSPAEGLEAALKTYARPGRKTSVYVFGDDHTGASYDGVLDALRRLNFDPVAGRNKVRVHAVGFVSRHSTARYATLMREATRVNGGTFLALPVDDGRGNAGVAKPNYRTGVLRRSRK